jgi:hypothetical protein
MAEPDPIVERLAAVATEMIENAGDVARTAAQPTGSDDGPSAAKNLIDSMTKLTNVALAGSLELAKAGADGLSRPGARAVTDRMAAITRRMISESGKVAEEASGKLDSKSYTPSEWVESMVRWSDIALFGGIELAETMLAGPGQYEKEPIRHTYKVAPDDDHPRLLVIASLSRPGAADDAAAHVRFDPANGVLPRGETDFSILITPAGLASGLYIGRVHIGEVDPDVPAGVLEDDVVVNVAL